MQNENIATHESATWNRVIHKKSATQKKVQHEKITTQKFNIEKSVIWKECKMEK